VKFSPVKKSTFLFLALVVIAGTAVGQGLGIPSKHGGLGFGNLQRFTGIRLNFIDKNVEKIVGINVTVWNPKDDAQQTGTMTGIAIGLPMAMGVEDQRGISVGIFGVGAKRNITGLNIGGLGVGAGGAVRGVNLAGLGVGAGGDVAGVTVALLGVGSGGNVKGINIGGLGVGAGGSLTGFNFGGLGVGSGGDVTGINIGGLGVGSGEDLTGFNFGGLGVGAGGRVRGLNLSIVGIGSGGSLKGISIAGLAAGSVEVGGLAIAPVIGGQKVTGIIIAPVWLRIGNGKLKDVQVDVEDPQDGEFTGLSVSIFNRIKGIQKGVTIGAVNYTKKIRGIQFGLINIVKENPKGLRVLPVFNTRFGKKGE
jgi:hypothetical protein